MGNSLGNLTSWESSAESEHVLSDLSIDSCWCFVVKHIVVHEVSTSNALDIIDVVSVDGWEANTTVVHLSSEDLVSEEVVTEHTAVRVGKVV